MTKALRIFLLTGFVILPGICTVITKSFSAGIAHINRKSKQVFLPADRFFRCNGLTALYKNNPVIVHTISFLCSSILLSPVGPV